MSPSRPFILRPVATSLLMAGLLLAGAVAYLQLPVSALPQVDYPTIQVQTFYPGASPDVMASSVTSPLERQFGQVPGLNQMTSSSSFGCSVITLQFALELNIDVAEQQVQAAINASNTYLPKDLPNPPVYNKINPADAPILTLALTSKSLPLSKVEDLADTRLVQKISQLPGVGLVSISGGQRPAVRVQANPTALASFGMTMADIRTALAAANVNQAKGSFDGKEQSYTIGANDQLLTSDQYRTLIVKASDGARTVRLSDVANVIDDAENTRLAAWMNENPSVIVNIQRQPGANIIEVVDRVKKLLPQLRSSMPSSVEVEVLTDRTTTIRASVSDVQWEMMLTIALVVMVIFLFLRNIAATVIPSVAVPLSIVGTFGVMYLLGYSLNNLTLMALTISTGFVVDDAIVMIENIVRYVEEGESPLEAALKGSAQIGFTIVSLSVSLIAVLIPLLFMGDIVGRLFREFAVTLSVTIIVSAVVSLTLTPMMCAKLLRHKPADQQGRLYKMSERAFESVIEFYGRTLRFVLNHQPATLVVAVATLALTIYLYIIIPKGFFPVQDTGLIQGVSEAPQDISFSAMVVRQEALSRVILHDPAVQSLSSFIGVDGTNTTVNSGRIQINLKPLDERKISAADVIRRLQPSIASVDGITLFMQPVQDLTVEDRVSRTQYQYSLESPDPVELADAVGRLVDKMKKSPVLVDVASDLQNLGLHAELVIDRDMASRLGISLQTVDDALYDAFGQRQVSTMFTQSNQYRVVLEALPKFQSRLTDLGNIYVGSASGGRVPLSTFTHVEQSTTPLVINHQGQFPAATISFNITPGSSLGDAVNAIDQAKADLGLPASVQARFEGTAAAFQASLANESLLILAALVTVYIVLGVLYESYVHPITILSTLPSAGVGAVGADDLRGRLRRHRADRDHPAHRHREKERHHDDRLRARRRTPRRQAAGRGDLPGLPAPLPAHPHDDHGGAAGRRAAGSGQRRRLGTAAAARHRDDRWADLQPGPDPLHDAGDLPLLRSCRPQDRHERIARRRDGARGRRGGRGQLPASGGASDGAGMSMSAPFIRRPVATTLLTLAIGLAGALSYGLLPVSPLPQVDFPSIQVSANLPGASPDIMASAVATPLERQFGRIAGITEMTSSSTLGSTNIALVFDLNRNIDAAARDVQAAINAARGQLPSNLPNNPSYRKVNPADAPIMILALTSKTYDTGRMYDVASSVLQQKLAQLKGVGQVTVGGGALPAVRVEVNPTALNNFKLGLDDVRTVLGNANANRPKGDLADSGRNYSLGTSDQLLKAREYRPIIVAYRNGAPVRLEDVAGVTDSVEDIRTGGLSNGVPSVVLVLFRQPGANIIETVDGVYKVLPELRAEIPAGMNLDVDLDRTTTIRASVKDVEVTLVLSIALVILVVFVFLRDVRSTLIPSVAVPISLVGTFGVMYLCGYSIDNLSLMAMTIATGFVVDDAIVVIENITRHIEEGLTPLQASFKGAREIGFTVVSISVSLVAVFIPILLMGGIVGRLFREFAVTLSVAIGVSLVVSLTTTPMMCAMLLKPKAANERHGWLYNFSEKIFDGVLKVYEVTLAWVLRHQFLMILVTLGTMGFTVYLYGVVPKGFFPQQDTGRLSGTIRADQDTSYQTMRNLLANFADIVGHDDAVESVIAFTGGGRGSLNTASMFVALKPKAQRAGLSADQVMGRLRGKTAKVAGADLIFQAVQDLRVGGRGSSAQYQYTLLADDLTDLYAWAPKVTRTMRGLPTLVDVQSDQQIKGLAANLAIDRATASRLGVTTAAIDSALYDAFGQRQVSTMYTALNQYHVVMEVDPRFSQSPDGLKNVYVKSTSGGLIPLSEVTRYAPSNTPLAVNHSGQFPSVTISFNLPPGVALGSAVADIEKAMHDMGVPASVHGSFGGAAQAFQDSLSNEWVLIVFALLAVYIVLGILYESLIHPITILSTLPSAGVGALLALLMCDTDLSVIALIGIILLIGIVKKNAIMMIDFAIEAERNQGKGPEEAIFQACLLRFRPIIMTTLAALLGGLPLALGTGTGAELRRPLGIAIVGGLIFSQVLTLYTTPVIYLYLDRFRIWCRQLVASRPPTPPPLPTPALPLN